MVFAAAEIVGNYTLENRSDRIRPDVKPGFFQDFTSNGIFEAFTGLNTASGQGPETDQRWLAALDKQDMAAITLLFDNDRAHAQNRPDRIAAAGIGVVFFSHSL